MKKSLVVLLALTFSAGCVPYSTGSTEVGVRTNKIGGVFTKGVQDEIYRPGSTNFLPAFVTDWDTFDTALQNLEMTLDRNTGDRQGDDSLHFKTIDGNDISVNVTVSWRVDPNAAPYMLKFVADSTAGVEDVLVRPASRTFIRDVLNLIKSEEYYNAELRFKKAEEAKALLNKYLQPEGVIIEQVLLGEHKFNAGYQQVIADKKAAEQQANRLISETQAAQEQVLRDLARAKGEVSRTIEEAKGKSQQKTLEADAIYFERQRQAEAILAEKKAQAEGLTERAAALAGAGGANMVKLKVAESLKGKQIVFLPAGSGMDVRTTDVNALLQRYGVDEVADTK